MTKKMALVGAACVAAPLALAGCASESKDIAAAYASPTLYQTWSCKQIGEEDARLRARVAQLAGSVDDRASNDAVAMGVGMVLFWPALFFLKGDGPEAQEYARLKGEHEALQRVAVQNGCAIAPPVTTPAVQPIPANAAPATAAPVTATPVKATPGQSATVVPQ